MGTRSPSPREEALQAIQGNDTLTPFAAFQLFQALRHHFTSSYDFFKYKGKVAIQIANPKNFDKHPHYGHAVKLSRRQFPEQFALANVISGEAKYIGNLSTARAVDIHKEWRHRTEGFEYLVREQLQLMDDHFDANFLVSNKLPKFLELMVAGKLWPETLVVFNRLLHFDRKWDQQLGNDIIWKQWKTFIHKYDPFVRVDNEKIRSLLIERFTNER